MMMNSAVDFDRFLFSLVVILIATGVLSTVAA